MKVIAYFAVTLDGFIAGEHDDVSWISKDAWADFEKLENDSGAIIVGRRTYDLMSHEEFRDTCRYIVLSSDPNLERKHDNVVITDNAKEHLNSMKNSGHDCSVILGGAMTFNTLLRDGLIDEVRIIIEPVLIGDGIRLFEGTFRKLKLLESSMLNKESVRLIYKTN